MNPRHAATEKRLSAVLRADLAAPRRLRMVQNPGGLRYFRGLIGVSNFVQKSSVESGFFP